MVYRDRGAIGALLDEYERAVGELKDVINAISNSDLSRIIDAETEDEDCRSVQTILSHVIRAGYHYATAIRNHLGEQLADKPGVIFDSIDSYCDELDVMFEFNVSLFDDYPQLQLEEFEDHKKIKTRWKQSYDVEQIMEHAIVHILRHRRQIERFKLKM